MRLGLADLLTLVFVICKLAGVIDWSWWIVFAPTLIGMTAAFALMAGGWIIVRLASRMEAKLQKELKQLRGMR